MSVIFQTTCCMSSGDVESQSQKVTSCKVVGVVGESRQSVTGWLKQERYRVGFLASQKEDLVC